MKLRFDEIARRIEGLPSPTVSRVIAIDGPGGAGKSTLAGRLAGAFDDAPIVHTDDFASWDEPLDWWPRFLDEALEPLAARRDARYRRYDWEQHAMGDWVDTAAAPVVIVEGVSSSRRAFRPYLTFAIWVETPRSLRLDRGLERDGHDLRSLWEAWIVAEDGFFAEERPDSSADLVVAGAPTLPHDPATECIVLREGPA